MKILILGEYPLQEDKSSIGPESTLSVLIRKLGEFKELKIVVGTMRKGLKKEEKVKQGNISIHYLSFPRPKILTNLARGVPKLKNFIKEISPDIVHTQGGVKYPLSASLTPYPWVHTIHGITFREANYWRGGRKFQSFLFPTLEKIALKKCKHIISICEYVEKEYSFLENTMFHRIPNPIHESFFSLPDKKNTNTRILFLGSISTRKDPLCLLQAIVLLKKSFPGIEVHLVGNIKEPNYYRKLERFSSQHNLATMVKFAGWKDRGEVMKELEESAVIVLPSRQETLPMSIAESMAAGKPVICTRVGGIPEMVEDGKTGFLIEPGDWHGLAEKISLLLKEGNLRREMGKRARQKAETLYHPEVIARKTLEVYREILQKG
ncbi:glycosyltransferase family 4 protein [Candidatus Calescamantes bacterium]|nr:glycosyltransferase family 4 protein [Candidatus Calescamantes bacterium]